ncbi:MAG: C40 family peptidase, partial [Anaerolineales bacterium]|nr:C40 family peptidase [Anaerolineales bacterium]
MKNFYKKFTCLLLLVFAGTFLTAQPLPFKTLLQELQSLQKQLVPDKRVAILEVEMTDTLQPVVVVSGETNLPEAKLQIIRFLNDNKISFVDSLKLLPDASLGEETWALATLSVSNLRSIPDHVSELVSQVMMGTPLRVLDCNEKWCRVQTPEYYIGWMDTSGFQRITQKELDCWKASNRYLFNSVSGNVYDAAGKRGEVVSDLVQGDLFEVDEVSGRFLKIKIPDCRTGYVRKADCIPFDQWINLEPGARATSSLARQMMGYPYLWGGTSVKAADCSGFVKQVYYMQGVILARDASQQARYGEAVDFSNRNNLQTGDLLFFGRDAQHITHVGIYLGNGNFVHASGRVHISSLDPGDPKYVPSRKNVAARRVFNS